MMGSIKTDSGDDVLLDEFLGSLLAPDTFTDFTSDVFSSIPGPELESKKPKLDQLKQDQTTIQPLSDQLMGVFIPPLQPVQPQQPSQPQQHLMQPPQERPTITRKRDQPGGPGVERQLEALKQEAEIIKGWFKERHPSFEHPGPDVEGASFVDPRATNAAIAHRVMAMQSAAMAGMHSAPLPQQPPQPPQHQHQHQLQPQSQPQPQHQHQPQPQPPQVIQMPTQTTAPAPPLYHAMMLNPYTPPITPVHDTSWFLEGHLDLTNKLLGIQSLKDLCSNVITTLVTHLKFSIGEIYAVHQETPAAAKMAAMIKTEGGEDCYSPPNTGSTPQQVHTPPAHSSSPPQNGLYGMASLASHGNNNTPPHQQSMQSPQSQLGSSHNTATNQSTAPTTPVIQFSGSCPTDKKIQNEFKLNLDPIVQQVVKEKKTLCVRSTTPTGAPCFVLVMPVLLDGDLKAVLCFVSLREVTLLQLSFLNQVGRAISLAINSAQTRQTTVELLDKASKKLRVLQVHSRETYRKELTERSVNNALNAVLSAAADTSFIVTDLKGVITYFNSGAENILGYKAHEMIGKMTPVQIHVPAEMAARLTEVNNPGALFTANGQSNSAIWWEALVARAKRGISDRHNWTYVRKDGAKVVVNLTITCVKEGNEVVGFLGLGRLVDVSRPNQQQRLAFEELS